jgi:hypothetical protein
MSEQADEEMSFHIEIPNNTLGIFVSCEPGSQDIVLHLYEFVDDSARVEKEYDAMAVLSTQICEAINQIINSFIEEVDEDFTWSESTDGDQYGLQFPKLNRLH